jgi:hypothetical protein
VYRSLGQDSESDPELEGYPTIPFVSAVGGLCQEAKLVELLNKTQADTDRDAILL